MQPDPFKLVDILKESYDTSNYTQVIEVLRTLTLSYLYGGKNKSLIPILISLSSEWIEKKPTCEAYLVRATCYWKSKENDKGLSDCNKIIELDEAFIYAYTLKANILENNTQYLKAIKELNKAIKINPKYTIAYNLRGRMNVELGQFDSGINDYNKALEIDPKFPYAYNNKGNAYSRLEMFDIAIKEYTKALELDSSLVSPYVGRGNAYLDIGDISKAMADFNRGLEIDREDSNLYNGLGSCFLRKKDYKKAIANYDKAIEIDNNAYAHYNKGILYTRLKDYKEAIKHFKNFLKISTNDNKYLIAITKSQIKDLQIKIKDSDYSNIVDLVSQIKRILLYKEEFLTHYTSLSGAKSLIIDKSLFRLSEGSYLNDTSEGKELFDFLNFGSEILKSRKSIPEVFSEKPFIGSFVSDAKHDDLTLWRMYGKEEQAEAKGCAITINKERLINSLKLKTGSLDENKIAEGSLEDQFTFYRVAYRSTKDSEKFIIPGSDHADENELNRYLLEVQQKIKKLGIRKRTSSRSQKNKHLLNEIAYLFKTAEYQHENEIRLVMSGVGFEKEISTIKTPPKVYIELVQILSCVNKITLGPKVEKADEWSAAFNYTIKKSGYEAEIIISHLPFK